MYTIMNEKYFFSSNTRKLYIANEIVNTIICADTELTSTIRRKTVI